MISIEELVIRDGDKTLVSISLDIKKSLALVGQSGSGKSLSLKALLNLLPQNLDLALKTTIDGVISIVVQNPFTALSPLTKIKSHFEVDRSRQYKLLELVGLKRDLLDRYPSELSGGQLQRLIVALSLEYTPKLLLLDEPTTALDSKTKQEILFMIRDLQRELDFKILYVTHDIDSTRVFCDRVAIIKDGTIVERGDTDTIFQNPSTEYTKSLIEASFKNRRFRN
jgi:peptide/nickel transport system ATP-binding protein